MSVGSRTKESSSVLSAKEAPQSRASHRIAAVFSGSADDACV